MDLPCYPFRQVGEGTGRAIDVDHFDDYYQHLVVWHDQCGEVVGAYRIGATDQVVPRFGAAGLYTDTLFRLAPSFVRTLGPALELGRSFVRSEYQREFAPLSLLWKGIGQVVAREPRYATLFGAVSISGDYATLSQQLLMSFLTTVREPRLARLVSPKNPPLTRGLPADFGTLGVVGRSVERIDELVREVERGQRGVPVLLRQYMKLNARCLAFNVDPGFANVLDALMVVDLRFVADSVLRRYLSPQGAARFRLYHDERRSESMRPLLPPSMPAPAPA